MALKRRGLPGQLRVGSRPSIAVGKLQRHNSLNLSPIVGTDLELALPSFIRKSWIPQQEFVDRVLLSSAGIESLVKYHPVYNLDMRLPLDERRTVIQQSDKDDAIFQSIRCEIPDMKYRRMVAPTTSALQGGTEVLQRLRVGKEGIFKSGALGATYGSVVDDDPERRGEHGGGLIGGSGQQWQIGGANLLVGMNPQNRVHVASLSVQHPGAEQQESWNQEHAEIYQDALHQDIPPRPTLRIIEVKPRCNAVPKDGPPGDRFHVSGHWVAHVIG
jgi:hypothetical protein